jgi:hypothetical protein
MPSKSNRSTTQATDRVWPLHHRASTSWWQCYLPAFAPTRKILGLAKTTPGALNTDFAHLRWCLREQRKGTDTMKTYSIVSCIISVGLGAVSPPLRDCVLICFQKGPVPSAPFSYSINVVSRLLTGRARCLEEMQRLSYLTQIWAIK